MVFISLDRSLFPSFICYVVSGDEICLSVFFHKGSLQCAVDFSADTMLRAFSVSSSGRRALVFFPCSLSGFGVRTMLASWNKSESSHLWVLLQEKDWHFLEECEEDWQLFFVQLNFPVRLSSPRLFFGEGFSSLIESSCLILVYSCWPFLHESLSVGCEFVGLYLFIPCYFICQHRWFIEVAVLM